MSCLFISYRIYDLKLTSSRRSLALELLKASHEQCMGVECLARTPSGGFVVKALLNLGGDVEEEVRRQLLDLRKSFQDLQAKGFQVLLLGRGRW